jgi:hypothetical protein
VVAKPPASAIFRHVVAREGADVENYRSTVSLGQPPLTPEAQSAPNCTLAASDPTGGTSAACAVGAVNPTGTRIRTTAAASAETALRRSDLPIQDD